MKWCTFFSHGDAYFRIWGLTLKAVDLENGAVNIDHRLQRTCDMRYIIEETKVEAGKRKILNTEDVIQIFRTIIENRELSKMEKVIDGYIGFLFDDAEEKLKRM